MGEAHPPPSTRTDADTIQALIGEVHSLRLATASVEAYVNAVESARCADFRAMAMAMGHPDPGIWPDCTHRFRHRRARDLLAEFDR